MADSSRPGRPLALLLCLLMLAWATWRLHGWLMDDAFISYRYAGNLAAGQGPVFNPGERVDGYTSFLWVLLLALGKSLGADILLWSRLLGLTAAAGCLLLVLAARGALPALPAVGPALGALLLASCSVFVDWSASGMEVTTYALLLTGSVLGYLRFGREGAPPGHLLLLSILLGLLVLTRPEGSLVCALLLAHRLLAVPRARGKTIYLVLPLLLMVAGWEAWRWAYYGYPLPNTFYAKVGGNWREWYRGLRYALRFGVNAFPLLVPALVALWLGRRSLRPLGLALPMVVLVVCSLQVVVLGGDHQPGSRFFAPLMPLICLLAASLVAAATKNRHLLAGAVTAMLVLSLANSAHLRAKYDRVAYYGQQVGVWLRRHAPPDALLATNTAGSVAYYSRLPIVDMLGLNDRTIAHTPVALPGAGPAGHEKANGAYVLARRPDIVQFSSSFGSRDPGFESDRQLARQPGFRTRYQLRQYRLPDGHPFWFWVARGRPVLPPPAP